MCGWYICPLSASAKKEIRPLSGISSSLLLCSCRYINLIYVYYLKYEDLSKLIR